MKKRDWQGVLLVLTIILYAVLYRFVILRYLLRYSELITASFVMFITFITYLFYGFQKKKFNKVRRNILIVVVLSILFYFAFIYGIGFITGFLKNSYNLTPFAIIKNIIGPVIIFTGLELYRYINTTTNRDKKWLIVLSTIAIIALELVISIRVYNVYDLETIFKIVTTICIPVIIKNCVLTYLTLELGYQTTLIYALPTTLYVYVVPIVPDLGDYMISMFGVILPLFIFLYSSRMLNDYFNGVERDFKKSVFSWLDLPFIFIILVLIIFVSGALRYKLVGVASGSMSPTLDKGDAVIIDQEITAEDIKKGDIIAYKGYKKLIIHRVVKVRQEGNVLVFTTRGDANNSDDAIRLTMDDIAGKVKVKIPYIAWPTVKFNEWMERTEKDAETA